MLRDVAFAYFLGVSGLMDGWAIAFNIPNLARRLFGEGAAASSLIPIYSEQLQRDPERAHTLALSVATAIFVLLSLVTIVGEVFIWSYYGLWAPHEGTKLKLALTGVMLPSTSRSLILSSVFFSTHALMVFRAPSGSPAKFTRSSPPA